MPLYTYHCSFCKKDYNYVHGINEHKDTCEICENVLVKNINTFRKVEKDSKKEESKKRIDKYIEEAKQDYKETVKEKRKDIK